MMLLTPAQLTAIQATAKLGMQTPITVYRPVPTTGLETTDDPYGSSDDATITAAQLVSDDVLGMFHSTPTPTAIVDAGQIVTVNTYRLWVPVGTDIEPRDRIVIGSNNYVVSDTTNDETWPAFLACSLRLTE